MRNQARHFALLVATLALMAVSLAACGGAGNAFSSSASNGVPFSTPDSSQDTPTPQFPVFTIGAWVSNYSPNVNDSITIYVICRVQDPTMQTASKPPPQPISVRVVLSGPINDTLTGTTGADGIAALPYTVNDPFVGQPVDVYAYASYPGGPWVARSFFTSSPGTRPTVTPGSTKTPGGPTSSPTP